jgi:hypothetical protein
MEIGFLPDTSLLDKARKHHLGYISRAQMKKERYEIQKITGAPAWPGNRAGFGRTPNSDHWEFEESLQTQYSTSAGRRPYGRQSGQFT